MTGTHFHILTATYNRPELLKRCYDALLSQEASWQWWVGDDASENIDFSWVSKIVQDKRIFWQRFDHNQGCNRTRNKLLELILQSPNDGFVLILDDDDYLAPSALANIGGAMLAHPEVNWWLSYVQNPTGEFLGRLPVGRIKFNYLQDAVIKRTLKGDFTHVIARDYLKEVRFCEEVKNGQEWTFFIQLAQKLDMYGLPTITKIGEYLPSGLTRGRKNESIQLQNFKLKVQLLEKILDHNQMIPYRLKYAKALLRSGDLVEAREQLDRVSTCHPVQ